MDVVEALDGIDRIERIDDHQYRIAVHYRVRSKGALLFEKTRYLTIFFCLKRQYGVAMKQIMLWGRVISI